MCIYYYVLMFVALFLTPCHAILEKNYRLLFAIFSPYPTLAHFLHTTTTAPKLLCSNHPFYTCTSITYHTPQKITHLSQLGEIITLPLVVLVTIMAQPRLQYAMSIDGLLPPIFSSVDKSGNLWYGTLFSGTLMVVIATVVPFTYLDDLISAGILVAFSMTDASVLLLRHQQVLIKEEVEETEYHFEDDDDEDDEEVAMSMKDFIYMHGLEIMLVFFHILSFIQGLILGKSMNTTHGKAFSIMIGLILLSLVYGISRYCSSSSSSSGSKTILHGEGVVNDTVNDSSRSNNLRDYDVIGKEQFQTPFVPYLPLAGIFANFYLIAQLEIFGLCLLVLYIGCAVVYYFVYGAKHSVGNNHGWGSNGVVVGGGGCHHLHSG